MKAIAPYAAAPALRGTVTASVSWISSMRLDLPITCICIALGMVVVSYGYSAARYDQPEALGAYWSGLALIMLTTTWRLAQPGLTRRERMLIVLALGLALYYVKVMQHPTHFAYHDEHAHWRSALDITRTGRLFNQNPLLPVTPLYPGLALATSALAQMAGLELHTASIVLISAARVVMMLGLFHLFESVTRSERAAGLACALYAANPNFLYFDAQFAYETLALPLAIMLVYAVVRSQTDRGLANAPRLMTIAVLALMSNAVTHHFTSYMTIASLVGWSILSLLMHKSRGNRPSVLIYIALAALLINMIWLLYVANFTLNYLYFVFKSAFEGLVSAAQTAGEGGGATRMPFQVEEGGASAPLYQRLLGFGAAGLTVGGIPFALWEVLRRHRTRAIAVFMAAAMCLQPFMYLLRLTSSSAGWEVSNRSSEFIFLGLAPLVALAAINLKFPRWLDLIKRWMIPPAVVVLMIGGIIVGTPTWTLLPWPYHAGSDQRSVEPIGIEAARWSKELLGTDRLIVTDRVNSLLWGTYGLQNLVRGSIVLHGIILSPVIDDYGRSLIRDTGAEFLVIDLRFSRQSPLFGYFYSEVEQSIFRNPYPIPLSTLIKFDNIPAANRIFDSGDIVVYDVKRLGSER